MEKEVLAPLLFSEVSTIPSTPSAGNVVAYAHENVLKVIGSNGETTRTVKVGSDGEIEIDSGFTLGTAITPPSLTANTDNLLITDIEKAIVVRLSSNGNYTLSGIVPFNATKAWMIYVCNVGTRNITIQDNDASSTAQNRFLIGGNKTLQKDEGVLLFYDSVSTRWRAAGINI